jgi:glycosyltransferase involved in cell wall biosynthesis
VLRGRHRFHPRPGALNLIWIISHPERPSEDELRGFAAVFAASEPFARDLATRLGIRVQPLLQCTDRCRFYPRPAEPALAHSALFVANSRKVQRRVVREAVEQNLALAIYGEMWEGLAPPEWIRGEKVENVDLPRFYASAGVVLNDHWESMRVEGFASNRIFDVLACAAPLVTDRVEGLPPEIAAGCTFFGDGMPLAAAVAAACRDHDPGRAAALAELVCRDHSYDARAATLVATIDAVRALRI